MTMWEQLVNRWHPADPWRPDEAGVRRYYETKRKIIERLNPRSVCEIGVRAGYSAFVFLYACPDAEYLGIDWGTAGPGLDVNETSMLITHAQAILPGPKVRFWWGDSHRIRVDLFDSSGEQFEFFHIDADHSYNGCTADLLLASKAKWILVDDFDVGPEVRAACRDFLLARPEWEAQYIPDGYRGNLLLRRIGPA